MAFKTPAEVNALDAAQEANADALQAEIEADLVNAGSPGRELFLVKLGGKTGAGDPKVVQEVQLRMAASGWKTDTETVAGAGEVLIVADAA